MVKKLLAKYRNSKEARNLFDNFLSLSVLQLVGYIFPLITLPYLARVLGVEKFGILAFASAVIAYFKIFVDFGFNYTAVRDIAQQKEDNKAVSKIFSTVMTIRFLFSLVSLIILLILIFTIPLFRRNTLILLLTFIYIPCQSLFPDWFFQAMEKMKFITVLNVLSKLLFTVLVFIIIKTSEDYLWQPVLYSMGSLISGILSLLIIIRSFKVKYEIPSINEIRNAIKGSWDMFVNLFFPNLYTNFSTILLRAYGGEAATGIFDAGNKFVVIAQQITNVLSRTFYPFLARRSDKHGFYQKMSLVVSILMSLCLFLGADLIIKIFYSAEFENSVIVLRILSVSIVFMFLVNVYGTNYLVLNNQEKKLKKITVWCSLVGFALSWYAVINWSYIGVAIIYITVRAALGILTWVVAKRHKLQQEQ
jgi:PST family polysaccharide transporter